MDDRERLEELREYLAGEIIGSSKPDAALVGQYRAVVKDLASMAGSGGVAKHDELRARRSARRGSGPAA